MGRQCGPTPQERADDADVGEHVQRSEPQRNLHIRLPGRNKAPATKEPEQTRAAGRGDVDLEPATEIVGVDQGPMADQQLVGFVGNRGDAIDREETGENQKPFGVPGLELFLT